MFYIPLSNVLKNKQYIVKNPKMSSNLDDCF